MTRNDAAGRDGTLAHAQTITPPATTITTATIPRDVVYRIWGTLFGTFMPLRFVVAAPNYFGMRSGLGGSETNPTAAGA